MKIYEKIGTKNQLAAFFNCVCARVSPAADANKVILVAGCQCRANSDSVIRVVDPFVLYRKVNYGSLRS